MWPHYELYTCVAIRIKRGTCIIKISGTLEASEMSDVHTVQGTLLGFW